MDQPDPHLLARVTPEWPPAAAQVRETRVLWSASEGQVTNAGVYLIALTYPVFESVIWWGPLQKPSTMVCVPTISRLRPWPGSSRRWCW